MAIGKAEWSRRLDAALALRGRDLKDLPDVKGFAKKAAARAGHDSDDYEPSEMLAVATAKELGLPVEWFTAEDFDQWINRASEEPQWQEHLVGEFRNRHAQLLSKLSQVSTEQEHQRSLLERRLGDLEGADSEWGDAARREP